MTIAATADLVEQAERRSRLASLLGRLVVSEPGPDLAPLVGGVPALAPLASGDPALAADYERLLLRAVPLYESVFLGDDGQRGGPVIAAVVDAYDGADFDESGAWRVAGPDHLGLELRCYGHLCAREAAGWRDERPDVAASAVDAERALLATHLGRWGEVAVGAVARRAGPSPYGEVVTAIGAFLAAEAERLRPAPDHPGLPALTVGRPPARLGPARLARWMLAPACSGAFLDGEDLGSAALNLGIPWRRSDPRSRFRQVVEDAVDGGDLPALLDGLRPPLERWHAFHAMREAARDGDRRTWREWRLRVEATLELVERASRARSTAAPPAEQVVVTVSGPDDDTRRELLAGTLSRLQTLEATVGVCLDIDTRLASLLRVAFGAGAHDVGLTGADAVVSATEPDVGGRRPDIVVVLAGETCQEGRVAVDADGPLADAVRRAVADLVAGEGAW